MAPPAEHSNPDDNNAHMIYIPVGVFGVLCPLLVGLRTWARLRKGSRMGADDYTIIAALVSVVLAYLYTRIISEARAGHAHFWNRVNRRAASYPAAS